MSLSRQFISPKVGATGWQLYSSAGVHHLGTGMDILKHLETMDCVKDRLNDV